jgi:hypothetical protein
LLLTFSLNDFFIIKNFYNTPFKANYRNCSGFILERLTAQDEVVATVGWHYGYFFNNRLPGLSVNWQNADEYINSRKLAPHNKKSFWYAAVHEEKFSPKEDFAFFNKNFILDGRADFFESCALHFRPATEKDFVPAPRFELQPYDKKGLLELDDNSSIGYLPLHLEKGNYALEICAKSLPQQPIHGINAHITLKTNTKVLGGCFAASSNYYNVNRIPFSVATDTSLAFELMFDNDFNFNGLNRSLSIASVVITRKCD